jgi:hypothetical protein
LPLLVYKNDSKGLCAAMRSCLLPFLLLFSLLVTGVAPSFAHEFESLGIVVRHKDNKVSLISAPPLAVLSTNAKGEKIEFDVNDDGVISFEEILRFEDEIRESVESNVYFIDQQHRSAKLTSFRLLEKGYENMLKISAPNSDSTTVLGLEEANNKQSEAEIYIQLSLKFEWQNTPDSIRLKYNLLTADEKHVLIRNQNSLKSEVLVLAPERATMTIFPIDRNNNADTKAIWVLGIEHVLAGLDHLLFIFTLVLVCKSALSLLAPLSAFTLSHSFALVLFALGINVNVPPWIIEASIALTIVIMASFEFWGWRPKRLFLVTALMGVIHGFGLGQALTSSIGGIEGWAFALVQVTMGIELAQLALALIFFTLLHYAFKRFKGKRKMLERGMSAMIICVGLFWAIERVVS